MVSAIDVGQPMAKNQGAVDDSTGSPSEVSNFGILHNYFRDRFFKYFELIPHSKWLIVEESLFSVIYFLLSPIPDAMSVSGSSILVSDKVSRFSQLIYLCLETTWSK